MKRKILNSLVSAKRRLQKVIWKILYYFTRGFGYLLPDGLFQTWWFFYIVAALWVSQLSDKEMAVWKKALEMKKDMPKAARERFAAECVEGIPSYTNNKRRI